MLEKRAAELRRLLDHHNYKYYVEDKPEISDREFDMLLKELEEIASLMMPLPIGLNLADVQNTYWKLKQTVLPEYRRRAA